MNSDIHILIVDDDPMILTLLSSFLRQEGYQTFHSFNGTDALKMMKDHRIDLVLLDVSMPKINGFELIGKMKENNDLSGIPVIFVSSSDDTGQIVKGFEEGGVDYIIKPFQKEELLARIGRHLKLKLFQDRINHQINELRASNRYLLRTVYQLSQTIEAELSNQSHK